MKKVSPRQKADRGRPNRNNCYSRGQNYEDTHYVFLQQFDENCDHEGGFPLHLQRKKEDYLEKELEPGDTLQTLSIQFNCPIAELKRINHIHKENEVFARRKIKVPVKYYSLLSEKLVGVHKSPRNSKDGSTWSSSEESSDVSLRDQLSFLKTPSDDNPMLSFQDPLLQDQMIFSTASSKPSLPDNCDNDATPLLQQDLESLPQTNNSDVFQCNGSDWGLSWPHLLICTLLLGFAGPIVYIFYLKETIDERNDSPNILSNHTST